MYLISCIYHISFYAGLFSADNSCWVSVAYQETVFWVLLEAALCYKSEKRQLFTYSKQFEQFTKKILFTLSRGKKFHGFIKIEFKAKQWEQCLLGISNFQI